MTDSTAPERIHLKFGRTEALGPTIRMWQASPFEGGTEYVRADLMEAQLAEADKQNAACAALIDKWINTSAGQDQEIEELKAQVAGLEGAQAWQPIEVEPKGRAVGVLQVPGVADCYDHNVADRGMIFFICYWDGETWREKYTGHDVFEPFSPYGQPTHWMPLPPAPQEGE